MRYVHLEMSKDNMIMFSYELCSSSLMEVNKEEIPQVQNHLQSEEDKEETSLGKRKIGKLFYYKTLQLKF
ncbi:hypothetical protein AtNW77_Chr4g0277821 [Arabidopsis thaliana]